MLIPPSFFDRLAQTLNRYRYLGLCLWLLFLLFCGLGLKFLPASSVETELRGVEHSEAAQVQQILEHDFGVRLGSSAALVVRGPVVVSELQQTLLRQFSQLKQVQLIEPAKPHRNKLFLLVFKPTYLVVEAQALSQDIRIFLRSWTASRGLQTWLTGNTAFQHDAKKAGKQDSFKGESLALLLSLAVLIGTFGALTSAFLPLLMGASTLLMLHGLMRWGGLAINPVSQILTGLVGLALAIDYSLFLVSRFKEEQNYAPDEIAALTTTWQQAGKTILVSGAMMLVSISALLIPDVSLSRTLVWNLMLVIVISLLNSLLGLPLLLLTGQKWLDRPRWLSKWLQGKNTYPYWQYFCRHVVTWHKPYFILSLSLLAVIAFPALSMKLWAPVQAIAPRSSESVAGYNQLKRDGWGGELVPVQVMVKTAQPGEVFQPAFVDYLHQFIHALEKHPDIHSTQSLVSWQSHWQSSDYQAFYRAWPTFQMFNPDHPLLRLLNSKQDITMVNIHPRNLMEVEQTNRIIDFVRQYAQNHPQYTILTGGVVARVNDFTVELYRYLPQMLALIVGGIGVLLLFYMRSIVLPIKAALMNFLPILSAFGVLTWVFQQGHQLPFVSTPVNGAVTNLVPLVVFCVTFGLSMDYEVLILSRISEHYHQNQDVEVAIIEGLSRSSATITGAVLILLGVFLPGMFSSSPQTQEICVGIMAAILLDATIVRLLLVPSFMRWMGHWNWWYPGRR